MAQPPEVRLRACQSGAVYAGLLAGSEPDYGSSEGIRDAVGLCVLERKSGDD